VLSYIENRNRQSLNAPVAIENRNDEDKLLFAKNINPICI
jgi:hypothetical protein